MGAPQGRRERSLPGALLAYVPAGTRAPVLPGAFARTALRRARHEHGRPGAEAGRAGVPGEARPDSPEPPVMCPPSPSPGPWWGAKTGRYAGPDWYARGIGVIGVEMGPILAIQSPGGGLAKDRGMHRLRSVITTHPVPMCQESAVELPREWAAG